MTPTDGVLFFCTLIGSLIGTFVSLDWCGPWWWVPGVAGSVVGFGVACLLLGRLPDPFQENSR